MNKKILGLDLGTNSIGWALIEQDFENKQGKILGMGSRVIPMSQDILGEFDKGNAISQTAERTSFRGIRRIRERHLLRRQRLHRMLNVLGFLPEHYANQIDFEKKLGQFKNETEPKLAYRPYYNQEKQRTEYEFIFKEPFKEMLADFAKHQPALVADDKKVPYDWTIYYLRKKALTQKIEKEELAWILLNFNQKRGYYQLRGEEEEENPNKLVEFYSLKIVDVKADDTQKGKTDVWYSLILENGWIYRRSSKTPLFDWKDKIRDFIVTTDLNDDGSIKTDKEGNEKRSFRAPKEDDWTLIKKKTEQEINLSGKAVGEYIYDTLLQNPNQKIKGKLVRTIERKFYKYELKQIFEKQSKEHPELQSTELYNDCVRELYHYNESQQLALSNKDFKHLFVEDIIFYQRPLKSQKFSIGNCALEYRTYKDAKGNEQCVYLKAIPKSHPLYQEFRLWQWIYNLAIYKKDDEQNPVTKDILHTVEDYEMLFDFLNNRKEIDQKALLKHFKISEKNYRWNFVDDKKYPCNETGTQISTRLSKVENVPESFLTPEIEQQLWHIIYSITDKIEYEKALKKFATKHQLDKNSFIENFKKFPPFKSEYGTYSAKAIKKLLPLMRIGKYWDWNKINKKTQERIDKITTGEFDETIKDKVREKTINLTKTEDFQGLPEWLTKYIVYGRHAEVANIEKWTSPDDVKEYLEKFRQHSLRNPIVEQVVTETLRVVKDIWQQYGNGVKDFFDEIHIELGREMKNTAEERERITKQVTENENTNLRLKALLAEMFQYGEVENVRPYSPAQLDLLKIYEEGALNSNVEVPEDILKISNSAQPTSAELLRYKLWMEQKYRSPYTGQIIPLNKLFTSHFEIEHIIPQSRYFDNSLSNKIICEAAVNKEKDNQLGLEFIKNHHGQVIETGFGKSVRIFDESEYEAFVKEHYAKNRSKRNKLMMEEIPDKMIERQLNDTRYISKFISSVLSNIVRDERNDDSVNSKNIIPGNGKITNELKNDWGLNDVWNELVLPRFERMNEISKSNNFTTYNEKYQKYLPSIPIELSKGFQKKRIDHRHHALDALVIACATRSHINLLNNKYAKSKERFDLNRKLRRFEKTAYNDSKTGKRIEREVPKDFLKPWDNFTVDAKTQMETIIVSFKQNLRIINKTTNKYESYKTENGQLRIGKDGKPKKEKVSQTKGDSWAIRKPMHKDTISGKVNLRKKKVVSLSVALDNIEDIVDKKFRRHIYKLKQDGYDKKKLTKYFKDLKNNWNQQDVSRLEIYYWENENVASRVFLDTSFNENRIENITDTGIQKILLNHLERYTGNKDEKGKEIAPESLAFSPEGIEEMNKNIAALNNGNFHKPIFKVRTYEPKGNKFNVGQAGNKKNKYVEAAKGTNLFFAIYWNEEKQRRNYETIPLNIVIERQKQGINSVPEINAIGDKLLSHLSPNDLVYVPDEEETNIRDLKINKNNVGRIYKVVSFTGNQCFFVKQDVATSIVNKMEFSVLNKMEKSINGKMIKEVCVKLEVGRLGIIRKVITGNGTIIINNELSDYYKKTNTLNMANEPEVDYESNNKIRFFNSFEEASESEIKSVLSQPPFQRLKEAVELILRTYQTTREELKNKISDNRIKFISRQ